MAYNKYGMMKAQYRHTQYGVLMAAVLLITGSLILYVSLAIITEGRWVSAFVMLCLYGLGVASFSSLTTEISDGKLKIGFGIGLIKKSYFIEDIMFAREVTNPWYYFWGIKSIPGGWLYAIAPGEAVEIGLRSGKIVRLGTDQSKILIKAIDSARNKSGNAVIRSNQD